MKKTTFVNRNWKSLVALAGVLPALAITAFGNGGPFVIKYPSGDPSAKGVLARLDESLMPKRETRLAVVKEDLVLRFEIDRMFSKPAGGLVQPPLVSVTASYLITNPTTEKVEIDFGFPILRGIYMNPLSMMPMPSANVRVESGGTSTGLRPTIIANSTIYGLQRRQAAVAIEQGIAADSQLAKLAAALAGSDPAARHARKQELCKHLVDQLKWATRDAELLAEYVALKPADEQKPQRVITSAALWTGPQDAGLREALAESAWATRRIGEQKATQWLALLAGRFDADAARSYEEIFQAWGGDVRERSVDLATGKVRPREITLANPQEDPKTRLLYHPAIYDPAVYARVDFLEADKSLAEAEKNQWRSVLKNLPVIFTFSPMNLLHYRVSFPPQSLQTIHVSYQQYAFVDTAGPRSYQLSYVVHPASLWDSFGPIQLSVQLPEGITPVGSMSLRKEGNDRKAADLQLPPNGRRLPMSTYAATLLGKTGEIFIGIEAANWQEVFGPIKTAQK